MKENVSVNEQIEKEALFGILPVLGKEKLYGFPDAVLIDRKSVV